MPMNPSSAILECVPNVSHGKDDELLQEMIKAIANVPQQNLLHVDRSLSANRTVFTFAGEPGAVVSAAFALFQVAARSIDMQHHKGAHPRIGAVDVCPLIPLRNCSKKEAIFWAGILAGMVHKQLKIPVFLYESATRRSFRKSLPVIRKGEYEGLKEKISRRKWHPDYATTPIDESVLMKSGASVIGVRNILVAWNVSLSTKDQSIASSIAGMIRTSGRNNKPGRFAHLRAIGWFMEEFGCAQVSLNLLDYQKTRLVDVWNAIQELAADHGCTATGCEIIGLVPELCVLEAGVYAMNQELTVATLSDDRVLKAGIDYLKLNNVKPFEPSGKILEYKLHAAGYFI